MILRKVAVKAAAVAAMAAAAACVVVALAYAVFALARPWLGPAGAGAVTALAAAVILGMIALVLGRPDAPRPDRRHPESATDRLIGLARQKPLITAGLGLVAAVVAIRNPTLLTTLVAAALGAKANDRR